MPLTFAFANARVNGGAAQLISGFYTLSPARGVRFYRLLLAPIFPLTLFGFISPFGNLLCA